MTKLNYLLEPRRIVIKYGTNALTVLRDNGGPELDIQRVENIAAIINLLVANGREPIIVSSAAVICGMHEQNLIERPENIAHLQLLSALGQTTLVEAYKAALRPYGLSAYQALPTHHNFSNGNERKNLQDAIELGFTAVEQGFAQKAIAVFNANDLLIKKELLPKGSKFRFTDNDPLAALVAIYCRADSLIIVSENGRFGRGGGSSKRASLLKAEKAGVRTNIDFPVSHDMLEEAVSTYFSEK